MDRPRPASVHSSLSMTWRNWRTRILLGLCILAFQFWPPTTETHVATTTPVTGWSLNRTVALRSVSRSIGDDRSDYRRFVVRGYAVYGIMVSITTWTMVSSMPTTDEASCLHRSLAFPYDELDPISCVGRGPDYSDP